MDIFEAIDIHNLWLDGANEPGGAWDGQRVLKIFEEGGEAVEAYIGMLGTNPRKGVTHSMDEFLAELADVLFAALGALHHFTGDVEWTRAVVEAKAKLLVERADGFWA